MLGVGFGIAIGLGVWAWHGVFLGDTHMDSWQVWYSCKSQGMEHRHNSESVHSMRITYYFASLAWRSISINS